MCKEVRIHHLSVQSPATHITVILRDSTVKFCVFMKFCVFLHFKLIEHYLNDLYVVISNSDVHMHTLMATFLCVSLFLCAAVTDEVRNISVEEGKNVILNPETEIQRDDIIEWRFGDQDILIAEIRGGTGETHDDDERFRGRLRLDKRTGSLTIRNITAEKSGPYKLQISSSRGTTNKTFIVTFYCK